MDLQEATKRGIPVFNSPFSNSRSVAELVLAEMIALNRRSIPLNAKLHGPGTTDMFESPLGSEVRGKTLGIIGYGHIGTQLSVLSDALGVKVIFYDLLSLFPLGTGTPLSIK